MRLGTDRLRGIYAIVNEGARDPILLARAALGAGVRVVQYRAKAGLVTRTVRAIRDLTRAAGALFIINDAWELVERYDADGAHVGPDDVSFDRLATVRGELGDRLLGVSCATAHEAAAAEGAGADYAGVGSVFATSSKADAGAPIGVPALRLIVAATALPVAAIGGITAANIGDVRASGAAMAAVLSALDVADPYAAALELVRAWA